MKKNFTVNISGIIFHIDEDAYSVLKNYLESIKKYYVGSDGADDIYTDIEGRIAEMLQEKLSDKKQLINIKDIEEVTAIMGQPQEFESGEYFQEEEQKVSSSKPKRLFRDPDNKMISGVCGGIGAYLNTDPLWFRLAFVLFTFIGGSGLLVYIILWLVIPEAKSTAEKLEMKGQQVNISTIEKKIKEEIGHLEKKLNDLTDKAKEAYKKKSPDHKSFIEKIISGFIKFIKLIFKFIIIVLGVAFIMLGIGLLIPLATPLFDLAGIHIFNFSFITHSELPAIKYLMLIFNSTHELSLALVGILLVVGIPVIMLIFVGIKLLFGLKSTKPIGITALVLWIIGVIMCGLIALQVGRDFKHKATTRQETSHQFRTDRPLYLFAGSSKDFDD
ncbi:MAG: PspC domain-containing protein, partial [Bacteroidales bacterium]|nr:PspC domain-containing protein [Bacteroidales bacterium]